MPVSVVSRLFCLSSLSGITIKRYWIGVWRSWDLHHHDDPCCWGRESQQEMLLLQADANSAGCVPVAAHAPAEPLPQLSPQSSRRLIHQVPTYTEVTGSLLPSWYSSLDLEGSRDSLKSPSFVACCSTPLWIPSLGWGQCFTEFPHWCHPDSTSWDVSREWS